MIYQELIHSKSNNRVYLLQTLHEVYGNIFKIGIAANPYNRIFSSRECFYQNFVNPIFILKTVQTDEYKNLEKKLHNCFKNERINIEGSGGTEWFKLEENIIINFFKICNLKGTIVEHYYDPIYNKINPKHIANSEFNLKITQKQLDEAMDLWNNF